MNTDEILAALRQVQEALRSCEYTKSSWEGGSSENFYFSYRKINRAEQQLPALIAAVEALTTQPQELTEDEAVEGTCKRVFFDDSLGHLRGDDVRKVLAHYKAAVRG